MNDSKQKKSIFYKIAALVLAFGPGIFAIGYTIGTGSVTSMIVAGSTYGMQFTWVLLLSCFFSGILMYAYGKFGLVTGDTALYGFKEHITGGKIIAILIIVGITFGQWNSLIGILGISSNIIFEILAIYTELLVSKILLCIVKRFWPRTFPVNWERGGIFYPTRRSVNTRQYLFLRIQLESLADSIV